MTATLTTPTQPPAPGPRSRRGRAVALGVAGVVAAAALGVGIGLSLGGTSSTPGGAAAVGYGDYQRVMEGYAGGASMMGGAGTGWMMGRSGYRWMMGDSSGAPQWMRGQSLPASMMGASSDMGAVMGRLFADAPGPRVRAAEASRLGAQVPVGAHVDKAANRITFAAGDAAFAVLASPSMPDESFRIAGLTDPTVVVPLGAKVTITVVNADGDMAHGLTVTSPGATSSPAPMMTAGPAFSGAALWFLGESTSAGMHEGTLSFTASTAGTYAYLCPVPGHAREGMAGSFVVRS